MKLSSIPTDLSFTAWQENQDYHRRRENRLILTGSFVFMTLSILGIGSYFYTNSPLSETLPVSTEQNTITLDLSTDNENHSLPSPNIATLPEIHDLPAISSPLPDLPVSIHHPVLPKRQPLSKINKQPLPVHHQPIHTKAKPTIATSSSQTSTTSLAHPPSQNTQSSGSSITLATWQSLLLRKLERLKHYPSEAQADEQEGTVILHISIDRQGHILATKIQKSSGHTLLDQETIALSHRADPLPLPPDKIKGSVISLTIPIQFYLKNEK